MRPSAEEIVRSVAATFDEYLLPEIEEPFARSLALTVSNLLRHVAVRIEHEGPMLVAEIADLRTVLGEIRAFAAANQGCDTVLAQVDAVCDKSPPDGSYVGIRRLHDEAGELGWALQGAIRALDETAPTIATIDSYADLRLSIRRHLRRSLEREGSLIVPAFTGERR
jgi:hypothetical protein